MIIHLYAACWNEIDRLDAFFAHYDAWVDRYFIFDDGSDDGSVERLARHPRVSLQRLVRTQESSLVLSLRDLYNEGWKASRGKADWVVVVNIDELVQHENMLAYLSRCKDAGYTMKPSLGYEIVPTPPPLTAPPHWALPNIFSNKLAVFSPSAISEVNYDVGRHTARPNGTIRMPMRDELINLHFKYDDPAAAFERMQRQGSRLRPLDMQNGWGSQYHWSAEEFSTWVEALRARAIPLNARHQPHRDNPTPRWWRPKCLRTRLRLDNFGARHASRSLFLRRRRRSALRCQSLEHIERFAERVIVGVGTRGGAIVSAFVVALEMIG